jgi:hypothetical protein
MQTKLLGCLAAMAAAIVVATPAMAFRGGGGFGGGGFGGGGFHGGFGGGGFHGGFGGGGFRGGMVTGRSVFVPGGNRFAGAPFAGRHFAINRFNNPFFFRNRFFLHNRFFPFRHRFFRNNFFFVGAPFFGFGAWPYYYDYAAYDGCWRRIWTGYGWQWTNICYDYGNYGYNYGYY